MEFDILNDFESTFLNNNHIRFIRIFDILEKGFKFPSNNDFKKKLKKLDQLELDKLD